MFGWRSGDSSADLDLENELNQSISEIDSLAKKGSAIEDEIAKTDAEKSELETEIKQFSSELTIIDSEIDELNHQLSIAKSNKSKLELSIKDVSDERSKLELSLTELNLNVERLERDYTNIGKTLNDLREKWNKELKSFKPEQGTISKWKGFGKPIYPKKIIAVGDVHGWAPGLINLIYEYTKFEVWLLGHRLDKEMISRRFPDPLDAKKFGRHLPRVGMNGHPLRKGVEPTPYDGLLVSGKDSDKLIIQVGDLIDRGEHNELILELMRQLMIYSPGSSLSLIGNHEAWIIEGDYSNWKTNEDRFRMHGRPRPGTTIHDPLMTGASNLDESMEISFKILEGALGALLLTQHFSILEGMEDIDRQGFSEYYDRSFNCLPMSKNSLKESVLNGGWELHDVGRTVLNAWRYESKNNELIIPGAFNIISIEDTVFCHAEPNGLSHPQSNLSNLSRKYNWCGREIQFFPTRMLNSTILDLPLLHARSKGDSEKVVEGLEILQKLIPGLKNYAHGHTPHNDEPITKFNVNGSKVDVINCDTGMTPIYRALRFDNPYDTSVIPFCHEISLMKRVDVDE